MGANDFEKPIPDIPDHIANQMTGQPEHLWHKKDYSKHPMTPEESFGNPIKNLIIPQGESTSMDWQRARAIQALVEKKILEPTRINLKTLELQSGCLALSRDGHIAIANSMIQLQIDKTESNYHALYLATELQKVKSEMLKLKTGV